MAHRVDWDGLHQELFLVRQLIHASDSFTRHENLKFGVLAGKGLEASPGVEEYISNLKYHVLTRLLASAINLRTIHDTLLRNSDETPVQRIAQQAALGLVLVRGVSGAGIDGIRECWNKIIHSRWASLVWSRIENGAVIEDAGWPEECVPFHWSGWIELHGEKQKTGWVFQLDVDAYCLASSRFLGNGELGEAWAEMLDLDALS